MSEICEALPWDSEFFALRIGRVRGCRMTDAQAAEIGVWARLHRIDCLYFLGDPGDSTTLRVAAREGFDLVDLRVTLMAASGRQRQTGRDAFPVRPARDGDVQALQQIARVSHRDSRFYRDGRFAHARCDDLFATWIEKSCKGYADAVLVADIDGRPVGYATGHLAAPDQATIGLLGIDPAARRRGCGHALVRALLDWFGDRGVAQVGVVTQGCNAQALSFYQRSGFEVSSIEIWYHRWFAAAGAA